MTNRRGALRLDSLVSPHQLFFSHGFPCVVDADPSRKQKIPNARWKKCWPFEIGVLDSDYDYKMQSGVYSNLESLCREQQSVKVFSGTPGKAKTFEYDFAFENADNHRILSTQCSEKATRVIAEFNSSLASLSSMKHLATLTWKLDSSGCVLALRNGPRQVRAGGRRYSFPIAKAFEYKRLYWKEGQIHHEDVLYFSYEILRQHPFLLQFISSRYPYIFLDEFQDTNPIQTQIIKWLAEAGTIVGIIGDPAQSIYKFQDARRSDFIDFSLPGMQNYVITGNRRSTEKIISLLNHIRCGDIAQTCTREVTGEEICLLVGSNIKRIIEKATSVLAERAPASSLTILARTNDFANTLRALETPNNNAWDEIREADYKREQFLYHAVLAIEYAHLKRFETAIVELIKIFKERSGHLQDPFRADCKAISGVGKRGLTLALLEFLVTKRAEWMDRPILDLYQQLKDWLSNANSDLVISGVRSGTFASTATRIKYIDLARTVRLSEENRPIRTIHNAKGSEFDAVLVCFEDASDLSNIINPGIDDEEDETRILYVALSRAFNHLFLSVPSINSDEKRTIEALGIRVEQTY